MSKVTDAEAQRIMSHMNAEHGESLGHYLEHFGRLPASLAYNDPKVTAFTTPCMKIAYGPPHARKEYIYEFDPPMHAGEARKRLEEMHQEARVKLGISDAVVNRISLSVSAIVGVLGCTLLAYLLLSARPSTIAGYLPWQARAFAPLIELAGYRADSPHVAGRAIQAFWLGTLYVAHAVEAVVCLGPYLRQYNVSSMPLRLLWRILTVLGGFPVWQSLRDAGKAEEKRLKSA